jgi:hypothetical protein
MPITASRLFFKGSSMYVGMLVASSELEPSTGHLPHHGIVFCIQFFGMSLAIQSTPPHHATHSMVSESNCICGDKTSA